MPKRILAPSPRGLVSGGDFAGGEGGLGRRGGKEIPKKEVGIPGVEEMAAPPLRLFFARKCLLLAFFVGACVQLSATARQYNFTKGWTGKPDPGSSEAGGSVQPFGLDGEARPLWNFGYV